MLLWPGRRKFSVYKNYFNPRHGALLMEVKIFSWIKRKDLLKVI